MRTNRGTKNPDTISKTDKFQICCMPAVVCKYSVQYMNWLKVHSTPLAVLNCSLTFRKWLGKEISSFFFLFPISYTYTLHVLQIGMVLFFMCLLALSAIMHEKQRICCFRIFCLFVCFVARSCYDRANVWSDSHMYNTFDWHVVWLRWP